MSATGIESAHSLFISDLHLCHSRPEITAQFISFLRTKAHQAEALYILGDLFEYWAGDDDLLDAHHQLILSELHDLAKSGTDTYFMHGNRDFLIADAFANAAAIKILPDPTLLNLYGKQLLLSHGDALCTDDTAYQAFRQQVRNPRWQQDFLAQPLSARKAQIETMRMRSEQEKSAKAESIMDVNDAAVAVLVRRYDYPELLIHGHTHRPAVHDLQIDGRACQRWVLGDWYEQGSYLRIDASGCSTASINAD